MQVSQPQEQLPGLCGDGVLHKGCCRLELPPGAALGTGGTVTVPAAHTRQGWAAAGPAASVQTWPLQGSLNTRKTVAREGGALR